MTPRRGQTSLEYLLILAGSVMIVILIASVLKGTMAPGMENLGDNITPALWPTPNEIVTPSSSIEFFFQVQDSSGTAVASFLPTGDITLKAGCNAGAAGSCANPPDGSFVIRDSADISHAFINSTGSLCIEDADCNGNDQNCSSPPEDSFVTMNVAGTSVSYISPTGALCLTGNLTQNGTP